MRPKHKKSLMAAAILAVFASALTTSSWAQDQPSLAERYLARLAASSRHGRHVTGGVGLAGGAALVAVGAVGLALEDEEDPLYLGRFFGAVALGTGSVSVVAGAFALAVPSGAERAYKKVLPLQDRLEREAACADALARLARGGRSKRMIAGGLAGAAGIALTIAAATDEEGGTIGPLLTYGALSAYFFMVKSRAERTYKAYLEQSRMSPRPQLVLGVGPRGGVRVGLTMDF